MTRIYEALEQYDLEKSKGSKHLHPVPQVNTCDIAIPPMLQDTLVSLYRTIFTVVPGPDGRIVQFVETSPGAGCSKIIRAFAKVSSSVLKKSVLLLDSDPQTANHFDFFNEKARQKWLEKLNEYRIDNPTKRAVRNVLSVSRLKLEPGVLPVDVEPALTEEFMERLKQTFDLTLVDSWEAGGPARPSLFSPKVDGVVLVIDATKTRSQIAKRIKQDIVSQGGNVLGVILNNRTYPIPDYIYSRLYG